MTLLQNRFWRYIAQGIALILVYVGAVKLSEAIIRGNELVSPIALSAGIAQAALLLLGRGMWPGVALGGFFGAISVGLPWEAACGTAMGSSLQALLGVELLHRWGVRPSLERLCDVLGFITCGVLVPTLVSPTVGLATLYLDAHLERSNLASTWWTGWLGEALGVLIVTPMLVTWCYPRKERTTGRFTGAKVGRLKDNLQLMNLQTATQPMWKTVWLISLLTVSLIAFASEPDWTGNRYPLEYLPLPLVIWAALQFGQRWSVLGTLLVSAIATGKTAFGISPFISEVQDWHEAILPLQVFMGIVAVTALVLAATAAERASAEESLRWSEAHYRSMFENAIEGIFQTTPDGKFISANSALACMLGYDSPDELMVNLTDIAHQLYVEPQRRYELIQRLQEENVVLGFESQIYCRDGRVSWISENIRAVDDFNGAILYYEGTVQDITERKQVQDLISQKHQELESQFEERTAALRATNRQLLAEVLEHKQAEKKLRTSQQRLSLLVQLAPLAVIEWNTKGEIVDWNPAAQAIFGYSKAEILGSRGVELLVPEWARQQINRVFDELLSGKGGTRSCNENQTKDGRTIICEWYNVPLIDARGNLLGAASMALDITERQKSQQALRESEERFALAIQANNNGLFDINLKTNEYYYSPQYRQQIGYPLEQEGPTFDEFWTLVHPDDAAVVKSTMDALFAGPLSQWQLEFRMFHSNGSILWILSRGLVIRDENGEVVRMLGTHTDISARKQAELELSRKTRQIQLFSEITLKIRQSLQLEAILQTTVTEVRRILQVDRVILFQLMSDGAGNVITETVVPDYPSILGQQIHDPCFTEAYQEKYRQGRVSAIDNLQHSQVKSCHVALLQKFGVKANLVVPILQRESLWGLLIAHQCSSPRQWQSFEIELLRQLADQVGIALAQSQLLEHETATRRQLSEKNLHLEQAKQEAEAANRAKSEFLANMSHELRTPLNGILGYTQILKRDSSLNPKQQQGLEIIQQCGEHLLTLLNDILDLSKIEARKMELHLSEFQFPQFLVSLVEIFRLRAEEKRIAFNFQMLSELPYWVRGDEKRLRQVLINLLGNAIKFTDRGQVTLKVGYVQETENWQEGRQEEQPKDSSSQASELPITNSQKMRFVVEDTGIGMQPEQLNEIFLPFHQIGESYRQVEGTGLGLTISQRLVQLMGGELKVKSTLGQGSQFWIDLDLPEVARCLRVAEETQERVIQGYRGKRRKVLVSDDKWENRSILVNLLSPLGFEVSEATDGQSCLDQALKIKPNLIIIDPLASGMNGPEIVRQLRQFPQLNDVVLFATSANVFAEYQHQCLAAGFNSFIPQPVQAEYLFQQLKVHLALEWIYQNESPVGEAQKVRTQKVFPSGMEHLGTKQALARLTGVNSTGLASSSTDQKIVKRDEIQKNTATLSKEFGNQNGSFEDKGSSDLVSSVKNSLVAPPASEIATLYELARMGDIQGIIDCAKEIEQMDSQYVPFAKQLYQLARGFQEKQILEFVKSYSDNPQ